MSDTISIIVGSSSQLAPQLETIFEEVMFFGRTNPHDLKNWVKTEGLESVEKINGVSDLISNVYKENDYKSLNFIFLQGISSKNWEESINVNQLSIAIISEKFCEYAVNNNIQGSITMIGSASAYMGGKLTYASTKASLNGLMTGLNKKYTPRIRANIILPGAFFSGMIRDWDKNKVEAVELKTLSKRIAYPAEIARAIEFCIRNEYVCNSVINMTSGQVVSF